MLAAGFRTVLLGTAIGFPALSGFAQTTPPAAATAAARVLGTVTAVSPQSVTVKQEGASSDELAIGLSPQTHLFRLAPGEKNLKNATALQLSDLAVGDRVLVRLAPDAPADHPAAAILIAMKSADISEAHAQEASDWQKRGLAGIAQSVDASSGTITLKAQGAAAPVVVHTSASTVVRHYAPDSTAFADAHVIKLEEVHPGDQIRARGAHDEAASTLAAEEVVAGSFRNIAGTVLSTDAATSSIAVTDLATKRPVTLHLGAGAQLRKLPPEMAARMAHRQAAAAPSGPTPSGPAGSTPSGSASPEPAGETARPHASGGDMGAMLQRAPSITLADLHKGDAVMIVASGPGAAQPTAITLIAGVEPLLQGSSDASAGLFSASWNLGGGGTESAGAEGGSPR